VAKCGTYVGAVMPERAARTGPRSAIVNVNALDIATLSIPPRPCTSTTARTRARRRARRRKFWMKTNRDRLGSDHGILGVIADDFTGATDIGHAGQERMRTIQTIAVPAKSAIPMTSTPSSWR